MAETDHIKDIMQAVVKDIGHAMVELDLLDEKAVALNRCKHDLARAVVSLQPSSSQITYTKTRLGRAQRAHQGWLRPHLPSSLQLHRQDSQARRCRRFR